MRTKVLFLGAVLAGLMVPALALAQRNISTFGGDAVVPAGETVNDVVTMGGDAIIDGTVTGSVVTMGGDVTIASTGEVRGDLVTMGGEVHVAPGGHAAGEVVDFTPDAPPIPIHPHASHHHDGGFVDWIASAVSSLASYALLFVLGLVLMGLTRERLDALQLTIVRQPLRAFGFGLLGLLGAVVTIVILAITIIGIPGAIVLAIALPFAVYVGLAAAATVIGAAIPASGLAGKPVLQLAAGCAALWVSGLVPFVGDILVAVAAAVGVGALVLTKFQKAGSSDAVAEGPYRTSVAPL